jgi:hypothetical protein
MNYEISYSLNNITRMKAIMIICLLMLFLNQASAQESVIQGVIYDENQQPVPYVSIGIASIDI